MWQPFTAARYQCHGCKTVLLTHLNPFGSNPTTSSASTIGYKNVGTLKYSWLIQHILSVGQLVNAEIIYENVKLRNIYIAGHVHIFTGHKVC